MKYYLLIDLLPIRKVQVREWFINLSPAVSCDRIKKKSESLKNQSRTKQQLFS